MSLRPVPLGAPPLGARRSRLDDVLAAGMAHMSIAASTGMDSGVKNPGLSKRQEVAEEARRKKWWKDFFAESDREEAKQKEQAEKEDELERWTKELNKSDEQLQMEYNIDHEAKSSEEPGEAPPLTERSEMTKAQRMVHDRIKREVITKWVKKHNDQSSKLDYNDAEMVELLEMGFTRDQILRYINKLRLAAAARAQE